MARQEVGVALAAEPAGGACQHLGVIGPMRSMAFEAAVAGDSGDGIVFIHERPRSFRMACGAGVAGGIFVRLRVLGWVNGMAVAADHSALGHGVVIAAPKLGE